MRAGMRSLTPEEYLAAVDSAAAGGDSRARVRRLPGPSRTVRARFGLPAIVAGLAVVFSPAPVRAVEARVDASFDAQFYSVASPFGDPIRSRRRYTSTLGLELLNLQGASERDAPTLRFRSRLRVDSDFGIEGVELDPGSGRFIPGLAQAPLDLMYAYLEGAGFFGGLVGFRLGRQYTVDALGFWSFDGARLALSLPVFVELSAFVGFEQRSGLPLLATSRYSPDGVLRGDRAGLDLLQAPDLLEENALAPAAGAALETIGLDAFHARVSYRKVQNRSTVLASPFLDEYGGVYLVGGTRTSSERAGASARVDVDGVGALSANAAYDVYLDRVTDADVAVDWFPRSNLSVGAELDYYYPSFDGDSIFNWFTHGGTTRAAMRLSHAPSRVLDFAWSSGARWFETEGDPDGVVGAAQGVAEVREPPRSFDVLATAGARYRFARGSVSLDALGEKGELGHRVGADITARRQYAGGRYTSLASVSLYDWSDSLRRSRDATSFTYVLGGSLVPAPNLISDGRLGFEWEHTVNRLVGQRFRVLVTLDLTVLQ